MLRKSLALLLPMMFGEMVAILIDSIILGNQLSASVLQTIIYVVPFGIISMVLLEQDVILVFNWRWHRFWLEKELFKRYTSLINKKLTPKKSSDLIGFPAKSNIQVRDENQLKDIIDVLKSKISKNYEAPLVISGQAGSGKSFVMLQATYLFCKQALRVGGLFHHPIPLLLFADDYAGDIQKFIQDKLSDFLPGKKGDVLSRATELLLRMGKFLIIIDGIEQTEETQRVALIRDIVKFVSAPAYKNNRYIFSCRSGYIDLYFDAQKFTYELVEIQPLSDDAVISFIDLYKLPEHDTQQILQQLRQLKLLEQQDLARNPYWLNLMVLESVFDKNPAVILGKAINDQLEKERGKEGKRISWHKIEPPNTQVLETRQLINYLAFEFVSKGKYSEDYLVVRRLLSEKIKSENYAEISPDDVIGLCQDAQILEETSLTSAGNQSLIKFRHSLIQNFLAASMLITHDELIDVDFVEDIVNNPSKWWTTLDMFGKLLETSDFILNSYKRDLLTSKLVNRIELSSALIRFCLLDSVFQISGRDELMQVKRAIVSEIENKDFSEFDLLSFGQVASLRPREMVDLISSINIDEINEPKIRGLISFLVKQEIKSGHGTYLLLQLVSQIPYHKIRIDDEHPSPKIDVSIIVKDAFIDIGSPALPALFDLLKVNGVFHNDLVLEIFSKIKDPTIIPEIVNFIKSGFGLSDLPLMSDSSKLMSIAERLKACIFCLGEIGDPDSIRILFAFAKLFENLEPFKMDLENSMQVAFSKMGEEGAVALLKLAEEKDSTEIGMISKIPANLAAIGSPAIIHLQKGLDHYSTSVRIACVKALGLMRDESSVYKIVEKIGDYDLIVRMDAVTALQHIGEKAVKPLIGAVNRETDLEGNYFKRVENEKNVIINSIITTALVKIGKDATNELILAADSPDIQIQKLAIEVLGKIGDENALPKLISMLEKTEEIEIINELLFAIGGIKSVDSMKFLLDYMRRQIQNNNVYMSISTFIAFARMGEQNAINWLIKYVEKGIEDEGNPVENKLRYHAAVGLAKSRIVAAMPALERLKEELINSTDTDDKILLKGLEVQIQLITSHDVENVFWDLETGVEYAKRFSNLEPPNI